MYSQYKIIDVLAKKAGGPYALSTVLIKRARQILKGRSSALGGLGMKRNNPIQEALEEFAQGKITIGTGEDVTLETDEEGKGLE